MFNTNSKRKIYQTKNSDFKRNSMGVQDTLRLSMSKSPKNKMKINSFNKSFDSDVSENNEQN